MPVFTKGSFSINLGFVSLGGELDDTDRQCAWELYCELVSRVALTGKINASGEDDFIGEVYAESLQSVYEFFKEARAIMRRYPVGSIRGARTDHLGFFVASMLEVVLRPFLEKWQASYRHWWSRQDDKISPFESQRAYPYLREMLEDWSRVRMFNRALAKELVDTYSLTDLAGLVPPELRLQWIREMKEIQPYWD